MTYLGSCPLAEHDPDPDESNHRVIPGVWIKATCVERDLAFHAEKLKVWSGLTDIDGEYGRPSMFTEWGSADGTTPIVADLRWLAEDDKRPCEHMIYIPKDQAA